MQRLPCGFCDGSLSADSRQEVKPSADREAQRRTGWHKPSSCADVHRYSTATQTGDPFHT